MSEHQHDRDDSWLEPQNSIKQDETNSIDDFGLDLETKLDPGTFQVQETQNLLSEINLNEASVGVFQMTS